MDEAHQFRVRPDRSARWLSLGCVVVFVVCGSSACRAGTDKDFDLACAVTAAVEVATSQAGSGERSAALEANVYFLGRLSGREPDTYWSAVVQGKLAELRGRAKNPDLYSTCLDFLTKQL